MDAVLKPIKKQHVDSRTTSVPRPSREEVEEAIKTLIRWAGDDPTREGLLETPKRVAKAYIEFFSGYDENPTEVLNRVFEDVAGYDDMVLVRDIHFSSHCEHHMVPFVGQAHIAYYPSDGVAVSYTHLRAHETDSYRSWRALLIYMRGACKHKKP